MKMKIVAVNIAFREESYYRRWRLLAEHNDLDVTLIGPKHYKYFESGKIPLVYNPKTVIETNFRVFHVDMKDKKYLRNDWFSFEYLKILIKTKPNFIYLLGYENRNIVFLTQMYRMLFAPKVKIALFTMRGLDMPMHGIEFGFRWRLAAKIFDAVFCHYPHGREVIRTQGKYKGPIYLQTQIGVNKDIYFPNLASRNKIRNKFSINDNEFVFGSAGRIEDSKGVFEIINACKLLSEFNFKVLLIGNGKDFEKANDEIIKFNLQNKVILTDRVEEGEEVASYLNALDCFIHIPKTTPEWVETFSLAVVQAMATKLPVIGSNSGSVPYQIGKEGILIEEGNELALAKKMKYYLNNQQESKIQGERMYKRALDFFEIRKLNDNLAITINALLENKPENGIFEQAPF